MKNLFYLAAIILVSYTITACNNGKRPADTIMTDSVTAIHNNDVNIAFTDTGKSDTTLLFVHGWAINKSYWANQVAYFGKRYRVVTIDLPGFGQSGKNRDKWGIAQFSSDIDSVIKQLDLQKVILVGHSMSGDIVLQAAIDNPNKVIGVVGVDNFKSVGAPKNPDDKLQMAMAIAEMRKDFIGVTTKWFNEQLFSAATSPEIKRRVLNDVAHTDSTIAVNVMEQGDGFDELDKLAQANKTLYLINSDVTPTDTSYITAQKLRGRVFYTRGTGHFAMVEAPAEFNRDLDMVIDDIKKNKPVQQ
ncbi:alpha/beta fold hydrolase [Mucilaginibacter sp. UR6-11]|uniref:alpha/beta fold hydrolase n=1 Tax=Mucilaginibacter sp. UR6-11 TaxID=1435644 RepID=UPI001E5BE1B7|nr:alpha/beta hydrolase [Mucilaginibacter sp. UR6-11]MCC8425629.1 alpha/beta hydrolase [Mucilaginibacter sp. UR6-11]